MAKSFRVILLLGLCLVGAYLRFASVSPNDPSQATFQKTQSAPGSTKVAGVPEKALRVLGIVRSTGQAPEGYVGGRSFQNREGRLPSDGEYREFDVDPHEGGRNAERIIVEWESKKAWYTGDHYQTFVPLP